MWKNRVGPEKGPKNICLVSERISEQETGVLPMPPVYDKNHIGDQAV